MNQKIKCITAMLLAVLVIMPLLVSCGGGGEENKAELHEQEVGSEPLILEEAPTKIQRGNIRLLCMSEDNAVLNEIVSRFNQSHKEQIELIHPENENSVDTESFYTMVLSQEYDILVYHSYSFLRTLTEAGYLIPMDDLVGSEAEKTAYLRSVLDAGRVEDSLYILAPFFTVHGVRTDSSVSREAVSSLNGLFDYIQSLSEWSNDLEREVGYLFLGEHGLDRWFDYENLTFDFSTPEFDQLLELDEILRNRSHEDGNTALSLYADPVFDATVAGTWKPEWNYSPFPMEPGQGYIISTSNGFVVSSEAQNLGTVEGFLTFLLSEEIQEMETTAVLGDSYAVNMELPVSRSALQKVLKKRGTDSMGNDWTYLDEWIDRCTAMCEQADHFSFTGFVELYLPYDRAKSLPLEERRASMEKEINAELASWRESLYESE